MHRQHQHPNQRVVAEELLLEAERENARLTKGWQAELARAEAAERALQARGGQRDDDSLRAMLESALEEQDRLSADQRRLKRNATEAEALALQLRGQLLDAQTAKATAEADANQLRQFARGYPSTHTTVELQRLQQQLQAAQTATATADANTAKAQAEVTRLRRSDEDLRALHQVEIHKLKVSLTVAVMAVEREKHQLQEERRRSMADIATLKKTVVKVEARCRELEALLDDERKKSDLAARTAAAPAGTEYKPNSETLDHDAAKFTVAFKPPTTVRQGARLSHVEPATRNFFAGTVSDPASCLQRLRALLHSDPLDVIGVAPPARVEAVAAAALRGGAPEAALILTQLAWHLAPKRDSTLLELPRAREFLQALYRAFATHARTTANHSAVATSLGCDTGYMLVTLLSHILACSPPAGGGNVARADIAEWVNALVKTRLYRSKAGYVHIKALSAALAGLQPPSIRFFNEHSNDPKSFRNVEIFPSAEELAADAVPTTLPEEPSGATALVTEACLGRHFRLSREDFLIPIREAVAEYRAWRAKGSKPSTRLPCYVLAGAQLSADFTDLPFVKCVAKYVNFSFAGGLHVAAKPAELTKPAFFDTHPKFLAEGSVIALLDAGSDKVVATGHIVKRDAKELAHKKSLIVELNASGLMVSPATKLTLLVLKSVQTFSIVPPLRCLQEMTQVPLEAQLLKSEPPAVIGRVIGSPRGAGIVETRGLNESQAAALTSAVTKNVTLIQGPPGTGKTHVGARVAKAVTPGRGARLLIVCYTNHALDQLLLKLVNEYGYDNASLKRFGGSAPDALADFSCRPSRRLSHQDHRRRVDVEAKIADAKKGIVELAAIVRGDRRKGTGGMSVEGFARLDKGYYDLMVMANELEFHKTSPGMHAAYLLHQWLDGKALDKTYLKASKPRDEQGNNQLIFSRRQALFAIAPEKRTECFREVWRAADDEMRRLLQEVPLLYGEIRALEAKAAADELQGVRVFGCTTSFAARNLELLRELAPNTIMVEEAAEILEAQVLATLTPSCTRLVMIGDHKQLRPKVQHALKIANPRTKYNLDRSLFERLIVLNGFQHHQLNTQHRMFKQLSAVVGNLSYPQLLDAPSVKPGARLKGFFNEALTFVDTSRFLEDGQGGADADGTGATSKTNKGEARFVTQVVRYMLQQDIASKDITVLSPYLGQVKLLKSMLDDALKSFGVVVGIGERDREEDTDDDESDDGAPRQRYIRVASVDNYQGEENEYVLVSLVRSNDRQEIGWLREPERLNVLLSRAKQGLVLFGSRSTFSGRSDQDVWVPKVFDRLRGTGSCVTHLTLRCRAHDKEVVDAGTGEAMPPTDARVARSADDMLRLAPQGGCALPCGRRLACGHVCPRRCHFDDTNHQKQRAECTVMVKFTCEAHGHVEAVKCRDLAAHRCGVCRHLRETRERAEREQKELAFKAQLAAQQFEIDRRRREHEHAVKEARLKQELDEKRRKDEQDVDYTSRMARLQADLDKVHAAHEKDMTARKAALAAKESQIRDEQTAATAQAMEKAAEAEAKMKAHQAAAAETIRKAEAAAKAAEAQTQHEIEKVKAQHAEAKRRIEARKDHLRQQLRQAGSDPTAGVDDEVECEVCCGDFPRHTMATCSGGAECHRMCADCFGNAVQNDTRTPEQRLASKPRGIPCACCPKGEHAGVFTDTAVQLFADAKTFATFQRAEKAAAEVEGKQAAMDEQERERALGEAQKHVRHIEDKILTLCCPHCNAAFIDFTDCCAVQCKCLKYFCAWCLQGSEVDNHAHVANCAENPMPGRNVFGNLEAFNTHHTARKKHLIEAYIKEHVGDAKMAAEVRERVHAAA